MSLFVNCDRERYRDGDGEKDIDGEEDEERGDHGRTNFKDTNPLKGPKLEIFVTEFFTQSKPVRVDDLGTRK